jgi:cytochrome c oxidase subunit 3
MAVSIRSGFQAHPYHLVNPSPWPIFSSFSLFNMASSGVLKMHAFLNGVMIFWLSTTSLASGMALWFRDIIAEGTYIGNHTLAVQRGLNLGIGLFIVSEALFFLGIFWAYFHSALSPTVEIGTQWPPLGIESINAFELPLVNTVILLSSGVAVTFAHHSLIKGIRKSTLDGILFTLFLAVVFTMLQGVEYTISSYSFGDGAFGSCFFFSTGFHGFHVIVGTIFIAVGFVRVYLYQVTTNHHLGVEGAILYWHFVDVVWLFLYVSVYYWGA